MGVPEAVIASAVRTPIGTAFKGTLADTPAEELAPHVLRDAVRRSGLTRADGSVVEFAHDENPRVNIYGSGCSLGHPIAASGARTVTTLVHELRRRGGGTGLATMCAGGGMGGAVIVEVS